MPAYLLMDSTGGRWAWDPDGTYLIVRAAVRASLIRRRTRVTETDNGFFMPTTWEVETDWTGFRNALNVEAARYWANAEMQVRLDPRTFFQTLIGLANDAINDTFWYNDLRARTQRRTSASISNNVDNWETALTVTRGIRDGSATFLIVTAGIVTGGAGLAAAGAVGMTGVSAGTAMTTLAVGSAMRGAFTYQDTGNVGSATVNAAGSFIVGAIGIGGASATLTSAETGTLIFIGSSGAGIASGAQAVIEGKSMGTAATQALVSAGGTALGSVLGTRIENMGFVVQAGVGTLIDLGSAAAGNALTSPSAGANPTPPRTGGVIDFTGLPTSMAEPFVRQTALCPFPR